MIINSMQKFKNFISYDILINFLRNNYERRHIMSVGK